MPKRSRKKPVEPDVNQIAARIVSQSTGQPIPVEKPQKNPAAVALGRLGGLKGGNARAKKLSASARRKIATDAARARWNKPNSTAK
jgi:hypothetical protein